jgi:hypothetical protein
VAGLQDLSVAEETVQVVYDPRTLQLHLYNAALGLRDVCAKVTKLLASSKSKSSSDDFLNAFNSIKVREFVSGKYSPAVDAFLRCGVLTSLHSEPYRAPLGAKKESVQFYSIYFIIVNTHQGGDPTANKGIKVGGRKGSLRPVKARNSTT